MSGEEPSAFRIRVARRHDAPAVVDLRVRYLGETARVDPRFALMPDVRDRTAHAVPVWIGQEDRILLVVEEGGAEEGTGTLVGYATGVVAVWPPVLKAQRVGEVQEVYLRPERRGRGTGRALLSALCDALLARKAQVLRAPVPLRDEPLLGRFRALGFEPLQVVMERNLSEP
jgi:GNAT superfamily N-acetyltransferase